MKTVVLISALAAGLAAAAPATAEVARLAAGAISVRQDVDGYPVLAEHRRERDCQAWAGANRALHRRFHRVRLRRSVRTEDGEKVYIVHVRNYRGRYYRVRYNACTRRITGIKRLRRIFCRHGRSLKPCLGRIVREKPENHHRPH